MPPRSGRSTTICRIARAAIITDQTLRLQYLAGFWCNNNTGTEIRDAILGYRQFPTDLFTGQPSSIDFLRALMMGKSPAP